MTLRAIPTNYTNKEVKNVTNHVGKTVFLECADPKNSYYNGEYIIVEQSPHSLFGMKPEGGYGGHEMKTFALCGEGAYRVISSIEDRALLGRVAKALRSFATGPDRGEKKQWIDYVYSGALRNAERLEKLLGCECPVEPTKQVINVGAHRITITIEPA